MKKGIVLNLISRGLFVIGSYLIHTLLARFLGPADYGIFGICLSILMLTYILLNNGVRQGISILISKDKNSAKFIMQKGLIIQLSISSVLGVIISLSAPVLAKLLNDGSLLLPIALCGIIVFFQGIYFIYVGTLNGIKNFPKENILLSTYAITRTTFTLLLSILGFGVFGALSGFLISSIISFILGFLLTKNLKGKEKKIDTKDLLRISIPTILIFGSITIIMNFDILSVKLFLKDNATAGYYTSAQAISKLPYWFLFAFGSVALPYISSFAKSKLTKLLKERIGKVLKISVLITLPGVILISVYSDKLVTLIYGNEYVNAIPTLKILIFALFNLGTISILAHIMLGLSNEKKMLAFAIFGTILNIVLNIVLVPIFQAQGAAWATFISSLFIMIFPLIYLLKDNYLDIKFLKLIISILSFFIFFAISYYVSNQNFYFLFSIPTLYLCCMGFFFLSGIIQKEEIISYLKKNEPKSVS